MERKSYIVAIDLGSSSVVAAVGIRQAEGGVEVLAIVSKPVEGVNAGRIDNIELVSRAIREAVAEVEDQLGIRISEAYAGISGEFVRCARHTDHVFVDDPENGVSQADVDALFDRMRNVQAPDDETIMERVPQNYLVDDSQEVKNPVGSFGKKLSSTFNFILCHKTPIQRLDMALRRLSIKMIGVVSGTLAAPEAVLSPDEKEEGVAVVDIGGGVTDVTVYYRNVVRYVATIPMGASAFNRDIRTMGVPEKHVENLKRKYGSAVAELAPEDKLIRVAGRTARDAKDIVLRNLATVIEARATDIAEFVLQEIKDSGYAGKLAYGIVLTGGSARMKDLDELFRRVTGMDVRVGVPEMGIVNAEQENLADPGLVTAVGILLKGAETGICAVVERPMSERIAVERPVPKPPVAEPQPTPQPAAQPIPDPRRNTFVPPQPAPQPQPPTQTPVQRSQPQPQPQQTPTFRHVPPRGQQPVGTPGATVQTPVQPPVQAPMPTPAPAPMPAPTPAPMPAPAPTPAPGRDVEEEPEVEPRRKRDWGSIFQRAFDKVNKSFTAAEDEEI